MTPSRQLSHPLFVASLVVLALNDHVLKGSGLVDGALTGKLSDVAGLLVAPLTLAWIARVRTRRGWLVAHMAVGVGFALLQLAPLAALVNELTFWRVWADPTDLLALPALGLSYVALGAPRPHRPRQLLGAMALILCTATSATGDPPARYPFPPAGVLPADVVVRHVGSAELEISVRRIRDEVTPECEGLLERPDEILEGDDFGDERRWLLARGDAIPLWDRRGGATDRDCYAVVLRDPHGREWFVTWRHGAPAIREWPIRLQVGEAAEGDAMRLGPAEDDPPTAPSVVTIRRRE